jgi:hypothetical protein
MPTVDPRYAGIEFPDYEFREYPLVVGYDEFKQPIIVNTADEKAAYEASLKPEAPKVENKLDSKPFAPTKN